MQETRPGRLIAQGRTADIHLWGDGYVIKLFHDWFEPENIEYEARLARAVHAAGVPTPAPGEVLHLDGRMGLIYERVHGKSMLEMVQSQPWRVKSLAVQLANLQAQMHSKELPADLPQQRTKLQRKISHASALPAGKRARMLACLEALPGGDRVCHGDFHPGNMLMTGEGAVIIDWIDAARGNPLADVARTTIILLGAAHSAMVPGRLMKLFVKQFHAAYLRHYFKLRPGGEPEYRRWLPVVAAARLDENIPEIEHWLLAQAQACA